MKNFRDKNFDDFVPKKEMINLIINLMMQRKSQNKKIKKNKGKQRKTKENKNAFPYSNT